MHSSQFTVHLQLRGRQHAETVQEARLYEGRAVINPRPASFLWRIPMGPGDGSAEWQGTLVQGARRQLHDLDVEVDLSYLNI